MFYFVLIIVIFVLLLERYLDKNYPKQNSTSNLNYKNIYSKKEYLMTKNELKFYRLLKMVTDKSNLNLFSQVALYAIVNASNFKDFNKIKSKTIDFVITDVNGKILICIELDDPTHLKAKRQERDNFIETLFKELNINLIRIPVQSYYNMNDIENKIKEKI